MMQSLENKKYLAAKVISKVSVSRMRQKQKVYFIK